PVGRRRLGTREQRLGQARHVRLPGHLRSLRRMTSRNPDQISSTAQTLLSTRPVGSAISRITFSVMSVGTFEAFLGQAIQSPAFCAMRARSLGSALANAARSVKNARITSS